MGGGDRLRTGDALEVAEDLVHAVWAHGVDDAGENFDGVRLLLHGLHTWPIAIGVVHGRGEAIKLVGLICSAVHSEGSPAEFIIVKVSNCTLCCLRVPELAETETLRLTIIWIFHQSAAIALQGAR
jgi:hypothetical protein